MEAEVREVIVRFYSEMLLRTLDANGIIWRVLQAFPGVARVCFEPMSDAERAEAGPTDSNQIVCVQHRCFVYTSTRCECRRAKSIEAELDRENV